MGRRKSTKRLTPGKGHRFVHPQQDDFKRYWQRAEWYDTTFDIWRAVEFDEHKHKSWKPKLRYRIPHCYNDKPHDPDNLTFAQFVGHRIRTRRMEMAMYVAELHEASGLSKQYIINIERGRQSIGFERMYKLALVLGRPLDYFVEGYDE